MSDSVSISAQPLWKQIEAFYLLALQTAASSLTLWFVFTPQGQADLLKHARSEVQENLKQIHYAALTCNLSKGAAAGGSSGSTDSKGRRSLEAIPEKATGEEELTDEEN